MHHGLREAVRRGFGAGAVVVAASLLSITPARASLSGGGQFQGTVSIAPDPCASQCLLTFNGWFRGSVGGIEVNGSAYVAVFPSPQGGVPAVMTANFTPSTTVTDNCPLGDTAPALTESGVGGFTVSGGALVDSAGNVFEQGISLSAGWAWTGVLVGSAATYDIGTSGSTVKDAQGHVLASGVIGSGAAVFVPVPPVGAGTCAAPGSAVGVATGALAQAA